MSNVQYFKKYSKKHISFPSYKIIGQLLCVFVKIHKDIKFWKVKCKVESFKINFLPWSLNIIFLSQWPRKTIWQIIPDNIDMDLFESTSWSIKILYVQLIWFVKTKWVLVNFLASVKELLLCRIYWW